MNRREFDAVHYFVRTTLDLVAEPGTFPAEYIESSTVAYATL